MFFDLTDAARFAYFYSELAQRGPVEFAAVLLPEFLSAIERGRGAEREVLRDFIGENAIRSLAPLTSVMGNNARIRQIASARMCAADWELLANFHEECEGDFPRAHPNLGLAMFAFRSAVEGEKGWQKELIRWWRKVSDHDRDQMDRNALAFISVAGERCVPGTAMELLAKVSLSKDDDVTFSDIAAGLLVHPQKSIATAMGLVDSARADDLARGLLIAQLLTRQLNDPQREHFLSVARGAIDELGILSLDAVCAVGALSRARDDARLLFNSEPALGIAETVHRVSCARAAANVLRNLERMES